MRFLLIVLVLLAACHQDCRSRCEKAGGHVEDYDCHDELVFDITTDMNGNTQTNSHFDRQCSHRCVGASAEMP
jgi:hypothetical protein